ncbi:MAG: M23 family metallopeptidase, partial [Candidatus Latescibacteria bacterium]|nr:M23 family metallopeptidase [Candidatus Latescibacterota bacterium]
MDRNGFSLLFVPHGGESKKGIREFRLSGTALAVGAAVGIFLAVAFVAMAVTYGSAVVDQMRFLKLQQENEILRSELAQMNQGVLAMRSQMDLISERDDILRHAAELNPLSQELRRVGVGGTYRDFNSEVLLLSSRSGRTMKETQTTLNQLLREAALELESLLEIEEALSESEAFLRGFPSIWPIDDSTYKIRVSSPYTWRIHPVTGKRDFHEGNDIVAPRGTPVRATADGRIDRFRDGLRKGSTFHLGNYVKIDHENGYVTYYGHLD